MKLTIGIKALNEELHIAESLRSALEAARRCEGEVILADSVSSDRTIGIARTFPVSVVQLKHPEQRCCGAGAQLAFQYAKGEYFYLLDGDMILEPDFVDAAITFLESEPEYAAVGGRVREMNVQNAEYRIRVEGTQSAAHRQAGTVDRLECGGLYRVSAVRALGYFADRNLHAFEEFELAARLRAHGWKLARINAIAAKHYGHQVGAYRLLWRRVRSGYAGASGEIFCSAIGQPQLPIVLRNLVDLRYVAIIILWWILLGTCSIASTHSGWGAAALAVLLLLPFLVLSMRRKSFSLGIYSFVAWNVFACGFFAGCLRKRTSPREPLASITILSAG